MSRAKASDTGAPPTIVLTRPRKPRASPLFLLVEARYEELKALWEDRFEKTHGFWRGFTDTAVARYLDCASPECGSIADIAGRDFLILAVCAIGYPIAKRLKIPAAPLIGPMVLSAAVHMAGMTAAKPPSELVNLAQIVIGTNVGCRFVGVPVRHVFKTMYLSIAVTLFMVALAVVFAYLLNRLTGFGFEALWLAFSPGGLAEMTLISLAMGIDTAFVSTHHLLRMLFMVTAAPLVFAWLKKRLHLKKPHPPKESHEGVANPEP